MKIINYKGFKIERVFPNNKNVAEWMFSIHPNGFYRYFSTARNLWVDFSELEDIRRHINFFEETEDVIVKADNVEIIREKLASFCRDEKNWGYNGSTARWVMWKVTDNARKNEEMYIPNESFHVLMSSFEKSIYTRAITND